MSENTDEWHAGYEKAGNDIKQNQVRKLFVGQSWCCEVGSFSNFVFHFIGKNVKWEKCNHINSKVLL